MKKLALKMLSALLAVMSVFSTTSVAFAKEAVTPVILVHGVGGSAVYENIGTEQQAEIKNIGMGEIKDILLNKGILSQALKLLGSEVEPEPSELIKVFADYFKDNHFNLDKNGNVKAGQGIINYWENSMAKHKDYWQNAGNSEAALVKELCVTYGAKNVYTFNYDWRVDVCQTAKGLRKFINNIKKKTGAKKVSLVGCSMGGAVLSAYLDAYKTKKDVARYVFVNPAIGGVDVARMYALDFKITKQGVLNYLNNMQGTNAGTSQVTILKALKAVGDVRIGYAAENLADFVANKKNVINLLNQAVKPWIGNIVSLWECVPYDSFDAAVKQMSKIGYLDKSSGVYQKIKYYHDVQGRFNHNVRYAKKSGAQVAIVANYGEPGIPVTSRSGNHIDGLIDTQYASAGATVAKFGKTLKAKGKYVSPDKVINAATCALPDNTWFIKDLQHMQFRSGTEATKFIAALACGKAKLSLKTVKKSYGYSQFIQSDENQNLSDVTA